MSSIILSGRFDQAITLARQLHQEQYRKGTGIPYIAHLLAVAALVLEDGGDEDQVIAALLHDSVEDQGGLEVLREIRRLFGDRVAWIVEGCSDSVTQPKPPWRERKEHYLEHLQHAHPDIRRVSLADKLHNARAILLNLREIGAETWKRFNGGKEGTLWYYRALVEIFESDPASALVEEFARTVSEIERLAEIT